MAPKDTIVVFKNLNNYPSVFLSTPRYLVLVSFVGNWKQLIKDKNDGGFYFIWLKRGLQAVSAVYIKLSILSIINFVNINHDVKSRTCQKWAVFQNSVLYNNQPL